VRGTLVLTPLTGLEITGIAEYYDEHDRNGAFHYFGDTGLLPITGALGAPRLPLVPEASPH
jgi:hypothetical protein